ncbi:MAG: bifunctional metallophosphatase/5'-nucleotidase [Bacteroidales bacterium]|nr:bifunctional metallophosphatase/5'-nucleotidase [Bacteroidales bacterium]
MKTGRYITTVLIFGLITIAAVPGQEKPKKLIILHTNDLHSRLNGFSPETDYSPESINDDKTLGGFARIAALIDEEKKNNDGHVLVVDAGDFLMGTFFHALEEGTGFQLPLMHKMGYDVVGLGNHEFDFGPRSLASILNRSVQTGPVPLLTLSNMLFSEKDNADDDLKALIDKGILKPYQIIEKNGLRLGVFGILGYVAIHDAPLSRPVEFADPVKTARKISRYLKETEKIDLVICLSHSGVTKDKNGNWTGEDVTLAQKAPDIDVIISGHTHTLIDKPLVVNGIPIVQTGANGTGLGRLELEVSQRKIIRSESTVIPVTDAIEGKAEIQQLIVSQEQMISQDILSPLKMSYADVVTETSFPLLYQEGNKSETSNIAPLITDAIYAYLNTHDSQGADIVLFPAGMIRDNIEPGKTGKQSVADLFRVVCLGSGNDEQPGYPLARVYVTGKELKGILEILYLAPSKSPDNYMYYAGLRATYNSGKGLFKKITSIETGNDQKGFLPLDWSKQNDKLYSLTANTYILEFVGIIKKLSKGLVKVTLKDESGNPIRSVADAWIDADPAVPGTQEIKEWMTLLWYLQQQPDINGNGIPDIPETYRTASPRLQGE